MYPFSYSHSILSLFICPLPTIVSRLISVQLCVLSGWLVAFNTLDDTLNVFHLSSELFVRLCDQQTLYG